MADHEPSTRAHTDGPSTHAQMTEHAIRTALAERGITGASQVTTVAEFFNITASQARRKLKHGIWSLEEGLALQSTYGAVFANVADANPGGVAVRGMEPGVLWINGQEVKCEIKPGPMANASPAGSLVCSRDHGQWAISTLAELESKVPGQLRYMVDLLQVLDSGTPLRIAVLDDDLAAADSLAFFFNESGYPATPFASADELAQAGFERFDVFILDFVLKEGGTSKQLIGKIRMFDANAVIMLLTGKLRGNTNVEAEIAEVVREYHVEISTKPTMPSLLLASVLASVSRIGALKNHPRSF